MDEYRKWRDVLGTPGKILYPVTPEAHCHSLYVFVWPVVGILSIVMLSANKAYTAHEV